MVASRSSIAALVLGLGVLSGSSADSRVEPERRGRVIAPASRAPGMWIWTRADIVVLERERARRPDLVPGVLIATLVRDGDRLVTRRGLSPARVQSERVSAVVRLDDSVHRVWDSGDPFTAIDRELGAVLREARATGAEIHEVQLDYDAPSRRLREWAHVVQRLAKGSLGGMPIWITSVPTHLADPDYGRAFAGAVVGHELQLFDTGLDCTESELARIEARLQKHALAFRLGVARFERARDGRTTTSHGCWSEKAERLKTLPGYAGTWEFPAGESR
jgi:hypothetical protein